VTRGGSPETSLRGARLARLTVPRVAAGQSVAVKVVAMGPTGARSPAVRATLRVPRER